MIKDATYFRELAKSKLAPDECYIEKSRDIVLRFIEILSEDGIFSTTINKDLFNNMAYNGYKLQSDKLYNTFTNDFEYYKNLGFKICNVVNEYNITKYIFISWEEEETDYE